MAATHTKEDCHHVIRERVSAWSGQGVFRDPQFFRTIRILSVEEKCAFHIEVVTQFCEMTEEQRRYCGVPDAYDRNSEMAISFERGVRSRLVVNQVSDCRACRATGGDTCFLCEGQGIITCEACDGRGGETCPDCSGNGRRHPSCSCTGGRDGWGERCASCGGSGSTEINCWSCNSSGWKSCIRCGGRRETACGVCEGTGFINCQECKGAKRVSIATLTEWKYTILRQKRDSMVEGLPQARYRREAGEEVFSETSAEALSRALAYPGLPAEFGNTVKADVATQNKQSSHPPVHRVTLRKVSLQEVRYALNEESAMMQRLWIIGNTVYAPKAPLNRVRVIATVLTALVVAVPFLLLLRG